MEGGETITSVRGRLSAPNKGQLIASTMLPPNAINEFEYIKLPSKAKTNGSKLVTINEIITYRQLGCLNFVPTRNDRLKKPTTATCFLNNENGDENDVLNEPTYCTNHVSRKKSTRFANRESSYELYLYI